MIHYCMSLEVANQSTNKIDELPQRELSKSTREDLQQELTPEERSSLEGIKRGIKYLLYLSNNIAESHPDAEFFQELKEDHTIDQVLFLLNNNPYNTLRDWEHNLNTALNGYITYLGLVEDEVSKELLETYRIPQTLNLLLHKLTPKLEEIKDRMIYDYHAGANI
jgi:hypothetical protein